MQQFVLCAGLAMMLAGCGDPLRDLPRLADADVAEDVGQADALPGPEPESIAEGNVAPQAALSEPADRPRGGLLGFLRGRAEAAKQEDGAAVPAPDLGASREDGEAGEADSNPAPRAQADGAAEATGAEVVAAAVPPPEPQAETGRGGLFGGLFSGGGGPDREAPVRRSAKEPAPGDPDYQQVGPGVTLPYGQIARLCGVPANRLGKKSQSYPERGRGYTVYDSQPGSTGLRNFYITGFDDGCARQFSAALVVFGPPQSYEQLRYSPAGKTLPVAETDRAYEKVKSRVCRVGQGKPCGNRMNQLAKDTVFVSIYERFGGTARWKNLLLHDGAVAAFDVKTN